MDGYGDVWKFVPYAFCSRSSNFLKDRTAVLLLDNVPSYPRDSMLTSDDSLTVIKFLLPNVTDYRVTASMK
jgi:hypothetical protein